MSETWYYADGERPVGPLSKEDLELILSKMATWKECLVWNASFNNWQRAADVAELEVRRPQKPPPVPKPSAKEKKGWSITKILYLIVALIAAAFGRVIGKAAYDLANEPPPVRVEETLAKVVAEAKPKLPQKLDDVTTYTDIYSSGKQLTYVYGVDAGAQVPAAFIDTMRKSVAGRVCTSEMKEGMVKYGISYHYLYNNSQGNEIGEFQVTARDCG